MSLQLHTVDSAEVVTRILQVSPVKALWVCSRYISMIMADKTSSLELRQEQTAQCLTKLNNTSCQLQKDQNRRLLIDGERFLNKALIVTKIHDSVLYTMLGIKGVGPIRSHFQCKIIATTEKPLLDFHKHIKRNRCRENQPGDV